MVNYKLGKLPAKIDKRTIRLKSILKALPPLPESYLIDDNLPMKVPIPMFANDRFGCCVISGRAHQTLRFECKEQSLCLPISDAEVLEEYFSEGCVLHKLFPCIKIDRGLIVLDSLKAWRSNGWKVGDNYYDIYAFSGLDVNDHYDVKASVALLDGSQIGIQVPSSVWEQFDADKIWEYVPDAGIEGGHLVHVNGYDPLGPKFISWGKQCQMTWRFWDMLCDEAYAVVDNRNIWQENSPIDVDKLDKILHEITGE